MLTERKRVVKNYLTRGKQCGMIVKLSKANRSQEKEFEKVLDISKEMWYDNKATVN